MGGSRFSGLLCTSGPTRILPSRRCATPQDRPAQLRKAVEAFNGKLRQLFYALGKYDGVAIVEFPDDEESM